MAGRHKRAEEGFLAALSGATPPLTLPRGPERLQPSFGSSPNWTLLSRVTDYIAGNRYGADKALEWRLEGELEGNLGFMMHEPHSRNYSRMHYAGYKALHHYASKWHPDLANGALLWLHHFHLMRAAATLPFGPPARKRGESRQWGGLTDCMPGQRTKKTFWSESSVECITGEVTGLGSPNKNRLSRAQMAWHYRATSPLNIGSELSPKQRKELRLLIQDGKLPTSFASAVYKVPLRTGLHIIRTDRGAIAWMDRRLADKPACLVIRSTKGGGTSYGQGQTASLDGKGVILTDGDQETRFGIPQGKVLFEIHQDKSGLTTK